NLQARVAGLRADVAPGAGARIARLAVFRARLAARRRPVGTHDDTHGVARTITLPRRRTRVGLTEVAVVRGHANRDDQGLSPFGAATAVLALRPLGAVRPGERVARGFAATAKRPASTDDALPDAREARPAVVRREARRVELAAPRQGARGTGPVRARQDAARRVQQSSAPRFGAPGVPAGRRLGAAIAVIGNTAASTGAAERILPRRAA